MAIFLFRSGSGQEQRPLPTSMGTIESDFGGNNYESAIDEESHELILVEIANRAVAKRELLNGQYTEADSDQQEKWNAFARGERSR